MGETSMRAPLRIFLAATTAFVGIAPALAQDAASESAVDIVVTARRVEERLQDVPISITVFNQEQVSNRNIVNGSDLATYTPSLSANSRFGPETATFSIRGFAQENFTSPSVAVYFADVIGPRANGGTLGGNGAGVGQFFDLQNVQVLKGPQGTLFGRNTTGGAVLIVPQRPKDDWGAYVEGSVGDYNMYRLQGVLNVPLSDTFKVRAGFERMERDGYIRNRSGIGPKDYSDTDYWAGRLSILADLTPNLENYIIARYSHSSTNGPWNKIIAANTPGCDAGVPRPAAGQAAVPGVTYDYPGSPNFGPVGGAFTPASTASFLAPLACAQTLARARANNYGFWDVEAGNPDPFLKVDQWGLINTTTWQASDTLTVKNIASYQQFRQKQSFYIGSDNYVAPANNPNPAFRGLPFTWVGLYPSQNASNVEQQTFTEELQLQGRTADGRLNYVVGGYYEYSSPLSPFQGSYSPITYVTTVTNAQNPLIPLGFGQPALVSLSCADVASLQCRPFDSLGSGAFPALLQNSLTRYKYENIGFFGQATYKFTDQFSATGGIRYTIDKTFAQGGTRQLFYFAPGQFRAICAVNNAVLAPNGGEDCVAASPLSTSRQNTKRPTWLIDVDYKPMDDILLYAKYARGYRQGNINASNTVPQGWGPEKVDTYELGAKASFRGNLSGYFNFAAFYNDFSDQQLAATLIPAANSTASPAQAIINAGKSRIQGFEVDALFNYSVFGLQVGYSYIDSKLKSFTPLNFPGYAPAVPNTDTGGMLPLTPKHKLTVTPTVRLPFDESVGSISLSATYVYTSKQISTAATQTPFGVVPSYNLLNLNINWRKVAGYPVDLSAFVTNVTNERYLTFTGGGWNSTGAEYVGLGMPRMFGVRARVSFGSEAN